MSHRNQVTKALWLKSSDKKEVQLFCFPSEHGVPEIKQALVFTATDAHYYYQTKLWVHLVQKKPTGYREVLVLRDQREHDEGRHIGTA